MAGILVGNSSSNEAIGELGWKGEKGDSAYEIAVQHGYTGTEEQWSDDFLNAENYYDKTEMNTLLGAKANASSVYTKTETDALLDDKANASGVYTKAETDDLVEDAYSTSEVKTNKVWIDGKPIYRKVIYVSGITKDTENYYSANINNIDKITNIDAIYYSDSGTYPGSFGVFGSSYYVATDYRNSTNQIRVMCGFNLNDGYVVLEYTKTTD